jgi:hypothetical protein
MAAGYAMALQQPNVRPFMTVSVGATNGRWKSRLVQIAIDGVNPPSFLKEFRDFQE